MLNSVKTKIGSGGNELPDNDFEILNVILHEFSEQRLFIYGVYIRSEAYNSLEIKIKRTLRKSLC